MAGYFVNLLVFLHLRHRFTCNSCPVIHHDIHPVCYTLYDIKVNIFEDETGFLYTVKLYETCSETAAYRFSSFSLLLWSRLFRTSAQKPLTCTLTLLPEGKPLVLNSLLLDNITQHTNIPTYRPLPWLVSLYLTRRSPRQVIRLTRLHELSNPKLLKSVKDWWVLYLLTFIMHRPGLVF